eukprot:scaffold4248_cov107-Skeletonema_marinoi.AAC.3
MNNTAACCTHVLSRMTTINDRYTRNIMLPIYCSHNDKSGPEVGVLKQQPTSTQSINLKKTMSLQESRAKHRRSCFQERGLYNISYYNNWRDQDTFNCMMYIISKHTLDLLQAPVNFSSSTAVASLYIL